MREKVQISYRACDSRRPPLLACLSLSLLRDTSDYGYTGDLGPPSPKEHGCDPTPATSSTWLTAAGGSAHCLARRQNKTGATSRLRLRRRQVERRPLAFGVSEPLPSGVLI